VNRPHDQSASSILGEFGQEPVLELFPDSGNPEERLGSRMDDVVDDLQKHPGSK
jgi:hypothetical protein